MSATPVVTPKVYVSIFLALLVFTGLTTGVAYVDLGVFNTIVALAIAVTKAALVVLFFMHLKYIKGMTKIVAAAALFWLAIMIALSLSDYTTRNLRSMPEPQGWTTVAPYK